MTTADGLNRATSALGELAADIRTFTEEVQRSEQLRTEKIRWIQKVLFVLVPAVLLLLVGAVTNFVLLARVTATNNLLFGCFTPNTQCSTASQQAAAVRSLEQKQTQFVIAICQRQNPISEDPEGTRMIRCVQTYYPTFRLPVQVAPTPPVRRPPSTASSSAANRPSPSP